MYEIILGGVDMTEKTMYLLKEFNKLEKELNVLYHGIAVKTNISDSASQFYTASVNLEMAVCKGTSSKWKA